MATKDIVVIGASAGGLWAIKLRGGTAVVQDPADAMHRSMPLSALDNVDVDYKVPVGDIGPLLGCITREQAVPEPLLAPEQRSRMQAEVNIAREVDPRV